MGAAGLRGWGYSLLGKCWGVLLFRRQLGGWGKGLMSGLDERRDCSEIAKEKLTPPT